MKNDNFNYNSNDKKLNQTWLDYARGYEQAALSLFNDIQSEKYNERNERELIFPLLFLVRHTIELFLKQLIVEQNLLKKDEEIKFNTTHEISVLWSEKVEPFVKSYIIYKGNNYIDSDNSISIIEAICRVNKFIKDLIKLDDNSYTFRYPCDKKNNNNISYPIFYNLEYLGALKIEFVFFCDLFDSVLSSSYFFKDIKTKF